MSSLPTPLPTIASRSPVERIRPALEYFLSGEVRGLQTVLGLLWLLDSGLQLQSFMYSRGFVQMLVGTAAGQPSWLADSINWAAHLAGQNLTVWNTMFAFTQIAIGLGLLVRRTVKPALLLSFFWVLIVWWFGEGFGLLLTSQAQPLTGAPGGAILYALVGLLVWPTRRPGGLLGPRGARIAWAALWLLMAFLWLQPASRGANATRAALLSTDSAVGWLTSLQHTVASFTAGAGLPIALTLALVSAAIGVGVGTGRRPRLLLGAAVILSLVYWLLAQGLGGVFAGGATDPNSGPLFILLACAVYPVLEPPSAGRNAAWTARERSRRRAAGFGVGAVAAAIVVAAALGATGTGGEGSAGGMGVGSGSAASAMGTGGGGPEASPLRPAAAATGRPLSEPPVYASHRGVLNVTLVASEKRVTIAGRRVEAKVYNGSFDAPTLMIKPGDLVELRLVNHLIEPTNLHFHGLEISPNGHADNIFVSIDPGQSFQYHFRLPRDAPTGTFWYHSHEMVSSAQARRYPMANSEEQVFDGLSGLIEVQGLARDLPQDLQHTPERYLALRDVQVAGGRIVSSNIDSNAATTRLIDGQSRPQLTIAPGQTQLWHIANIGADIFYELSLPGHTFEVLGQDGHPVVHAQPEGALVLSPGKRYDVLVRGGRPGSTRLQTLYFNEGDDHYPQATLATLVTSGRRQRPKPMPHLVSRAWPNLARERILRKRDIILSENTAGTRFFVNGQYYDPQQINFHARLGTVEQWTIVNHTDEFHVFHMHTYPTQLLSTNGVPQPYNGYQDEADVPPNGYVVVRIAFQRYPGVTVFHCHILSHEDMGMMANIQVSR